MKWKANISLELKASMTIKFDLGHDIEKWGIRYNLPDSDRVDLRCLHAVDSTSRSCYYNGILLWIEKSA